MKRKIISIIFVMILVFISLSSAVYAFPPKIEFYDRGTNANSVNGTNYLGQSFTAYVDHEISFVKLQLRRYGTANGTFNVNLYKAGADHKPLGSALWYGSLETSSIAEGSYQWYYFGMGYQTGQRAISGQEYVIVCSYPGGVGPGKIISVRTMYYDTQAPYEGGMLMTSSNAGVSWSVFGQVDMNFEIYGDYLISGNETVVVRTNEAIVTKTATANYTCDFKVELHPDYISQNVTARLSSNPDFSSPITLYDWGTTRSDNFTTSVWFSPWEPNKDTYGKLAPATTYYYQGYATVQGTTYYGEVRSFVTNPPSSIDKPIIQLIRISNVSSDYGVDNAIYLTGKIVPVTSNGTITSDVVVSEYFEISKYADSNGQLLPPIYKMYPFETTGDTFSRVIYLDDATWWNNETLYIRVVANCLNYGELYSKTVKYNVLDDTTLIPANDATGGPVKEVGEMIRDYLASRGWGSVLGKYLVIFIAMIAAYWVARQHKTYRTVLPAMVLGFGIIIGWVPVWLIVLLALVAGLRVYGFIRRKMETE